MRCEGAQLEDETVHRLLVPVDSPRSAVGAHRGVHPFLRNIDPYEHWRVGNHRFLLWPILADTGSVTLATVRALRSDRRGDHATQPSRGPRGVRSAPPPSPTYKGSGPSPGTTAIPVFPAAGDARTTDYPIGGLRAATRIRHKPRFPFSPTLTCNGRQAFPSTTGARNNSRMRRNSNGKLGYSGVVDLDSTEVG